MKGEFNSGVIIEGETWGSFLNDNTHAQVGLCGNHAYSVLDVREIFDTRFMGRDGLGHKSGQEQCMADDFLGEGQLDGARAGQLQAVLNQDMQIDLLVSQVLVSSNLRVGSP